MDRNDVYAWRTYFTNVGAEADIGEVVLLAQAMTGSTEIVPFPGFDDITDFQSAFLLAGWDVGDWTLAGRVEGFATQNHHPGAGVFFSEHGNALTGAVSWKPERWLRLTAEMLHVYSFRQQRTVVGQNPAETENQFQLSLRLIY